MSIIIACKKGDTIYMGTDTRVNIRGYKQNDLSECNYKIQKQENGMLVGVSSDLSMVRQTIFAYSDIFTLDKSNDLTKRHIVKEIIPKLIDVLKTRKGFYIKEEDDEPRMQAKIVLAYKDKMFLILPEFSIIRSEEFLTTGDCSNFGLSTMYGVKQDSDVNEKILKALEIASNNSFLVGPPYLLVDTKEQKYNLVGGNN